MDDRFNSLEELKESIELGLDIECYINNQRYYIGWSNNERVIALCPDGEGVRFNKLEEMLDYQIEGKTLRELWKEIVIRSM